GRVLDALPGNLRHMDQPVYATEVDKRAERREIADAALTNLAFLHFLHQPLALRLAPLAARLALREDQPATPLVHLDHLQRELHTDHARQPVLLAGLALPRARHRRRLPGPQPRA